MENAGCRPSATRTKGRLRALFFLVMNVAYEGELFAVGGPGIHVDGALPAEEFQNRLGASEACGTGGVAVRKSEFHILVRHVFAGAYVRFVVGDHHDVLAIWRNVREPCVPMRVVGDLRLFRAVGLHAPCLHAA